MLTFVSEMIREHLFILIFDSLRHVKLFCLEIAQYFDGKNALSTWKSLLNSILLLNFIFSELKKKTEHQRLDRNFLKIINEEDF